MSNLSVLTFILLFISPYLDAKALSAVDLVVDNPDGAGTGTGVYLPPTTGKKGMTFIKASHLVDYGIDFVGCNGCDAYSGDTVCGTLLPVLCAKIDNSPRPAYPVYGPDHAMASYFYFGWNRGHIATTVPVAGSQFSNRAAVDQYCAQAFGAGWRVAEFHDGFAISGMNGTTYSGASWTQNSGLQQSGGWNFYSYGDVRSDVRFWVHISDQPSTCWAQ